MKIQRQDAKPPRRKAAKAHSICLSLPLVPLRLCAFALIPVPPMPLLTELVIFVKRKSTNMPHRRRLDLLP